MLHHAAKGDALSSPGQAARSRTAALTASAMFAFAANSILCRMALRGSDMDAASFTALRLVSGAVCLVPLSWIINRSRGQSPIQGDSFSAVALFCYAAGFSFAYVRISTATGALLLFGMVQVTMVILSIIQGTRPHARQWQGLALALLGLLALTWQGLEAPDLLGLVLMGSAGVAWGIYSARGRGSTNPTAATAGNFLRAAPLSLVALWIFRDALMASARGIALAVFSGAVASALGYILWYAALRNLSGVQAALVQLSVPVLAALGGVALLHEPLTMRLIIAGTAIILGIALSLTRAKVRRSEEIGRG